MRPTELLEELMALDALYPFSITSGKRTFERNQSVGGHPNSRHLRWKAWDVVLDYDIQKSAFLAECERTGLKAIDEGDHIHVQCE